MKTTASSDKTAPDRLKEQNRLAWESRSKLCGASLNGVLFKNLPDILNQHLHQWHVKVILREIDNGSNPAILDVGCGYGRLSVPIIEKHPSAAITGIDISESYVKLYKQTTGRPAYVHEVEELPEHLGSFDYVVCVTVLMYLGEQEIVKAVRNLIRHLKDDGKLILIEPHSSGIPCQTAFGLLKLRKKSGPAKSVDTKGRAFKEGHLKRLFQDAGATVLREFRLPATSMLILPLALVCRIVPRNWAAKVFQIISKTDKLLEASKLPSMWAAYVITRARLA